MKTPESRRQYRLANHDNIRASERRYYEKHRVEILNRIPEEKKNKRVDSLVKFINDREDLARDVFDLYL